MLILKRALSQAEASKRDIKFHVARFAISYLVSARDVQDVPPPPRSENEQTRTGALSQGVDWGFPLTSYEVAELLAKYIQNNAHLLKNEEKKMLCSRLCKKLCIMKQLESSHEHKEADLYEIRLKYMSN